MKWQAMPREGVVVAAMAVLLTATAATAGGAQASERRPAVQVLAGLPVSTEMDTGYARELFRLWVDADRDGCDTRAEVLMDEAVSGSESGCRVLNGTWVSAYDGVQSQDPGSFDIDHLVPLKEAWESGAWRWNAQTRRAYANDLGYRHALIAVTASSNRSKADRDPAEWLPEQGRCAYAKRWIAVKFRWRLAVDITEKSRLTRILSSCPRFMAVPDLASRTTVDTPAPEAEDDSTNLTSDPRFETCAEANEAGYGPYRRGMDSEYDWYVDRDGDGLACES